MKIHEVQKILIEQQEKAGKKKGTGTESFHQIMEEINKKTETCQNVPENINPVQIIDGIIGTVPVNNHTPISNEKGVLLDSLKDALDLMDYYVGKLADNSFPADNLSSLIDQLQERLESIEGISSADAAPDKLKPILSDMVITISNEIEKFRRGDYV